MRGARCLRALWIPVLFGFLLVFSACAPKSGALLSTTPKILLISTPQFKFHDLGFVKRYTNRLSIEGYSLAHSSIVIDIWSDSICINGDCVSKARINREIFGAKAGYETLLEEIVLGHDIFQGRGKQIDSSMQGDSRGGIIQEIKTPHYHILYERSSAGTIFQERMRKIIFALKEIPKK
ncbi:MAG: hypothetical protein ACTTH5_08370 [Wolinella sp.]